MILFLPVENSLKIEDFCLIMHKRGVIEGVFILRSITNLLDQDRLVFLKRLLGGFLWLLISISLKFILRDAIRDLIRLNTQFV